MTKREKLKITPSHKAYMTGKKAAEKPGLLSHIEMIAPDQAPTQKKERAPLNICLALDVSLSMGTAMDRGSDISQAKLAASALVDKLGPGDTLSVVTYSSDTRVVVDCAKIDKTQQSKTRVKQAISSIETQSMTNMHIGWTCAAELVTKGRSNNSINKIMIMSDGCANEGLTDPEKFGTQCKALRKAGIMTSTYGLGQSFDERLMTIIGEAGGGETIWGKNAEDLIPAFEREIDIYQSVFASDVELVIKSVKNVKISMEHDYDMISKGRWELPNLIYGTKIDILTHVDTSSMTKSYGGDGAKIMHVTISYTDADQQRLSIEKTLFLPSASQSDFKAMKPKKSVMALYEQVEAAQRQKEIQYLISKHDFDKVKEKINLFRDFAKGNKVLGIIASDMEEQAKRADWNSLSKSSQYRSTRSLRSLSASSTAMCATGYFNKDIVDPGAWKAKSD